MSYLVKAFQLIQPLRNWTQRYAARDKNDLCVIPESPKACKWCSTGALIRVLSLAGLEKYHSTFLELKMYLHRAASKHGHPTIESLNDQTNHDVVLLAWRDAIAMEKADDDFRKVHGIEARSGTA